MGTVIVHAGMPKAGSSSIQDWLAAQSGHLRRNGVGVLVATDRGHHEVRVVPHESGRVVSGAFILGYLGFGRDPSVLQRFVEGIDRWTCELGTTVVTAEGFANFFTEPDPAFIAALDDLAGAHDVRIVCYVRPQHTSMEAAWCQWGYRLPQAPSSYLAGWADTLDYLGTWRHVREVAPHLTFDVRPFRPDLLAGGDVVTDFAERVLGVPGPTEPTRSNRGLPLELVTVLRDAPPGLLWSSAHDNTTLNALRPALLGVDIAPTPEADLARSVLHRYCHRRFEAANRELIAELAWPTDSFVPRPDPATGDPGDLAALDELLGHPSPDVTRALVFGLLRHLAGGAGSGPPGPPIDG